MIRQRKKKDESDKIIIIKKEDLDNEENKIKKYLQQFWDKYDTYSDDGTCYYRKFARENNFELVGWHRSREQELQENMTLNFSDIKQVEYSSLPKILLMFWDIETLNQERPRIFLIGEKELDEVYMI